MAKLVNISNTLEVKKSEAIVKARYKLSPLAIKFISIVISNLKRGDDANEEYILKVSDFKSLTGQKTNRIYELVDEAISDLLKNPLTIPLDDEKNSVLKANWVSGAIYNQGEIRFMIYPKLRPFLLEVKEKYLKYKLENILNLKSGYVIRLYEILKDWLEINARYGKKAEKVISLVEFREMLEIPHSYPYGGTSGVKSRMLEKAKKELEEHTDVLFKYEEIKTGRKVTHIKFIIKPNLEKISYSNNNKYEKYFKTQADFIKLIRLKYSGHEKVFGYKAINGKIYWLKIDNKGFLYGVSDKDIINFNALEGANIYKIWYTIAKNSELYQRLIHDGVCIEKLQGIDKTYLFDEIKKLSEQGVI